MMGRILFCVLFLLAISDLYAQKKRKGNKEQPVIQSNQPSSIDPNNQPREYAPKASKKKAKRGVTYDARADFDKRMERNWKDREKEEKNFSGERKADKSLPPYFGHKKPPKVRPLGKRKLCKVCGIVH